MKKESSKIMLAYAVGASVGALLALEMHRYFWWVGLLAGGLVGYLSYEWRTVRHAIPAAYRAARGWKAPVGLCPYVGWSALAVFCVFSYGLPLYYVGDLYNSRLATALAAPFTAFSTILAFRAFWFWNNGGEAKEWRTFCHAVAPPLLIFWHLPRGIIRGIRALPKFLPRFLWQLFLRIHSERRLICGVDAMLGAGVGYLAGSALIGTGAGALLGLLNYAVVTERWLRPAGYLKAQES